MEVAPASGYIPNYNSSVLGMDKPTLGSAGSDVVRKPKSQKVKKRVSTRQLERPVRLSFLLTLPYFFFCLFHLFSFYFIYFIFYFFYLFFIYYIILFIYFIIFYLSSFLFKLTNQYLECKWNKCGKIFHTTLELKDHLEDHLGRGNSKYICLVITLSFLFVLLRQ